MDPRQRENMKTNYLCMPMFKLTTSTSTSYGRNNHRRLSPMSLLDRLRQAVFHIIMLNALSKANHQTDHHHGSGADQVQARGGRYGYNYLNDPRHSEAVADCIEFIKKSGAMDG
ncbi:hypothetical protein Vadar_019178 [Vaccinium darrowii]|uniref:Uncharacterized protein n=1 Tax=Vaccinium darrowii TaxID=229202 RepID=A0ACB7Y918_9ERIC|nr:hypothetical protein Vadar_019178 [Vaccinium darrowii]